MIPNLASALAKRKKFIDEVSETGSAIGVGGPHKPVSKFVNFKVITKSATGYTGLQNQGATCYLNSLLQSLFMIPEFRMALYSFEYQKDIHGAEASCLTRQLQKLFVSLQLSIRGAVTTSGLTNSFGWTSADSFNQQDVQECMAVMFDFIITQCFGSELGSFFERNWQGVYFDGLTCLACEMTRGRSIEFRDLQLQVRGLHSLSDSIASFLEKENLDGVDCENCKRKTPHLKGFKLEKLPYILSLQLKRFDLDWNTFQRVKINDPISFQQSMDLSQYLDTGTSGLAECNQLDQQDTHEKASLVYELIAVLVHSGSAFAGHYFCYVKDVQAIGDKAFAAAVDAGSEKVGSVHGHVPGTEEEPSGWLCFNDSIVTALTEVEVASNLGFSSVRTNTATTAAAGTTAAIDPRFATEGTQVGDPVEISNAGGDALVTATSSEGDGASGNDIGSVSNGSIGSSGGDGIVVGQGTNRAEPVKLVASASNAYMLIYRQKSSSNLYSVPEEMIPSDLAQWIAEDNRQYLAMKTEWEYEQTFLDLHIVHRKRSSFIRIHESETVGKLTDAVHASLKAQEEKLAVEKSRKAEKKKLLLLAAESAEVATPTGAAAAEAKSAPTAGKAALAAALAGSLASTAGTGGSGAAEEEDSPPLPDRDCIRLRVFDGLRGVLMGPLGSTSSSSSSSSLLPSTELGDVVLSTLPREMLRRQIHVEVRQPGQPFASSTDELIPLEATLFHPAGFSAPAATSSSSSSSLSSSTATVSAGSGASQLTSQSISSTTPAASRLDVFSRPRPFTISAASSVADLIDAATEAAREILSAIYQNKEDQEDGRGNESSIDCANKTDVAAAAAAAAAAAGVAGGAAAGVEPVVCLFAVESGDATKLLRTDKRTAADVIKAGDRLFVDLLLDNSSSRSASHHDSLVGEKGQVAEQPVGGSLSSIGAEAVSGPASRLIEYFNALHNRIIVSVTFSPASAATPTTTDHDHASQATIKADISIDQRLSVGELKGRIGEVLGLDPTGFRLHRPQAGAAGPGRELKDLALTMIAAHVGDGTPLLVIPGRPLLSNEFRVKLFVHKKVVVPQHQLSQPAAAQGDTVAAAAAEASPSATGEQPPAGEAADDQSVEVLFIAEVIVTAEELVSDLKTRVYHQFFRAASETERGSEYSAAGSAGGGDGDDSAAEAAAPPEAHLLPLRLRLCDRLTESTTTINDHIAASSEGAAAAVTATAAARSGAGVGSISGRARLGAVLRDAASLKQSVKGGALSDGLCLVAQIGPECVGLVTEEHLLLCVREWDCVASLGKREDATEDSKQLDDKGLLQDTSKKNAQISVLLPGLEITVPKSTTVLSLKNLLGERYLSLPSKGVQLAATILQTGLETEERIGTDAEALTKPGDECGIIEPVLIVKPFAWQLKDPSNIPTLKWAPGVQPRDGEFLTGAPWRLQDGATLLFTSAKRYEAVAPAVEELPAAPYIAPAVAEVGFKIYTSAEQQQRKAEEQKEEEERKSAITARLEAMHQFRKPDSSAT